MKNMANGCHCQLVQRIVAVRAWRRQMFQKKLVWTGHKSEFISSLVFPLGQFTGWICYDWFVFLLLSSFNNCRISCVSVFFSPPETQIHCFFLSTWRLASFRHSIGCGLWPSAFWTWCLLFFFCSVPVCTLCTYFLPVLYFPPLLVRVGSKNKKIVININSVFSIIIISLMLTAASFHLFTGCSFAVWLQLRVLLLFVFDVDLKLMLMRKAPIFVMARYSIIIKKEDVFVFNRNSTDIRVMVGLPEFSPKCLCLLDLIFHLIFEKTNLFF